MMAIEAKVYSLGVGSDGLRGLTGRARDILSAAELVLGAEHTLGLVPEIRAEKLRIGANLPEVVQAIDNRAFGSLHPGVSQFVFCDGSTRSIRVTIDGLNLRRLAVRNDGDPVNADE